MKICITGKPCSGKSLAMQYIKKANYNTWIADEWVHKIYQKNFVGYKLIKKNFGPQYVNNIEVDRKALGTLVFQNRKNLLKLNNLINPLIKKEIEKLDKSKDWFIELGTYLYYHETFNKCFDKIILIFSDQNWKKVNQNKKFSYLKKIPTIFVDKSKNSSSSILYIDIRNEKKSKIGVDIFVNNCKNKNFFKKNILKICKNLCKV